MIVLSMPALLQQSINDVVQDAVGELGNRPVHLAAAGGHTAIVKLLLRQGANVVSFFTHTFVVSAIC